MPGGSSLIDMDVRICACLFDRGAFSRIWYSNQWVFRDEGDQIQKLGVF